MQVVTIKKRTIIRQTAILLLCGAAGWYLKGKLSPQVPMMGMGGGDPYVLVQGIEKQDISPKKNFIGHVEAINSVDLRPQVTGYVEKVLFQEGSLVKEGDILFVIEQKRYLATLELREAELASAKANLVKTERDYKRQKSLSSQNYASKATLDTSESNFLQAKAAVKQAEANLELAKIDMGYTEIKAPFTGYIGKVKNYFSQNKKVGVELFQQTNDASSKGLFWFSESKVVAAGSLPDAMMEYIKADLNATFGVANHIRRSRQTGLPQIKKVIYSGPKTIILWADNTKTIVSCGEADSYDYYSGFCAAVVKKLFGSTTHAKKVLGDSIQIND